MASSGRCAEWLSVFDTVEIVSLLACSLFCVALTKLVGTVLPRASFMGLAAMILYPQAYRRKGATIRKTNEVGAELIEAAGIIRLILNANGLTDHDVRPELADLIWGGELVDDEVLDISCVQVFP